MKGGKPCKLQLVPDTEMRSSEVRVVPQDHYHRYLRQDGTDANVGVFREMVERHLSKCFRLPGCEVVVAAAAS